MSTKQRLALISVVIAALFLGVMLGLWGRRHLTAGQPVDRSTPGGRTVLYWYDPMKPEQHFDKPGKSPYMDMELIPKYVDAREASGGVTIDPRIVQNLGIRVATVESGQLQPSVTVTGILRWNERLVAVIQARSAGFVTRVYGRAPGDIVAKGTRLADLVVPDWVGAQAELLAHASALTRSSWLPRASACTCSGCLTNSSRKSRPPASHGRPSPSALRSRE